MKRFLSVSIIFIMIVLLFGCESRYIGCNRTSYLYEYGDFIISRNRFFSKSIGQYSVVGLSKKGKEKTSLTIPSYFLKEENDITSIGIGVGGFRGYYGSLESDVLEVLYLNKPLIYRGPDLFVNCPNLQKIICLSKIEPDNNFNLDDIIKYDNVADYFNLVRFVDYEYISIPVYYYSDLDVIKTISNIELPGNIQYLDSLSDELYYLDFYDGGLIEDMPWTPVKEGYDFMGWYKEKECINKWDFDVDEVCKMEYKETDSYLIEDRPLEAYVYTITRIYAKWEKK